MISVIVPVYNAQDTLSRSIESVLNQTYTKWELLLIDDGSIDESASICDRYATIDERIKVFHIANGGPANARNVGLNHAHGEYIAFLDSDDEWLPTAFEQLLRCANEQQVALVQACTAKVYANGDVIPESDDVAVRVLSRIEAMEDYIRNPKPVVRFAVWGKLFSRDLIGDCRFENRKNHEDVEFIAHIIDRCDRVVYVPSTAYYTYVRENSLSRRSIDKKKIDDFLSANDTILSLLSSRQEYQINLQYALSARISCVLAMMRDVYTQKPQEQTELIRYLKKELKKLGKKYRFPDLPHKVLYYSGRISVAVHSFLYSLASKFF